MTLSLVRIGTRTGEAAGVVGLHGSFCFGEYRPTLEARYQIPLNPRSSFVVDGKASDHDRDI